MVVTGTSSDNRHKAGLFNKIAYSGLFSVGLALTIIFGLWWFEPSHVPHNFTGWYRIFDYLLFIVLSYIVWQEIVLEIFAWYIAGFVKQPTQPGTPPGGLRVAYLTAFVPGAEPYDVLENTLAAMTAVSYPHDTWLLDEGNDAMAQAICTKYGAFHYSRKGKREFNTEQGKFMRRTKGGNYNSWLHQHEHLYDIVAQHDVDFIPRKDFLLRTLGHFKDPEVGFVGTPQIYGNLDESWIARGAAQQTWGFYGFLQQGFYGQGMTLFIGANHLFRTRAFKDIDGYSAHIAEDMLTGMKFYTHRWKSVYVPEALLVGEGPGTWASYFAQQMRWAYGCMDIFFRHTHRLYPKLSFKRAFNYFWLQQFYFAGAAQAAGIVLLTLYFVFGITSAKMLFLPVLLLWVPLMIYQLIFQAWLQRFNIDYEKERGMMWPGRIMFIAAWPIFLLAFIGVLRKKRLTYVVTPKGGSQETSHTPSIFTPHLILGTITLFDVLIGLVLHHTSAILIFWAMLNTICMYGFFFAEATPPFIIKVRKFIEIQPFGFVPKTISSFQSQASETL